MKYLRAIIYWIYPQQGAIDALKRQVKAQEALIQTLRAQKQSIQIENDKLWAEFEKLKAQPQFLERELPAGNKPPASE